MADQSKQQQLDQIAADILQNNICPDLAKTATNLVMGEGSPNAKIMFIGEAPGKNEDLTGRPFVGAAGKFLNEMLEGAGLKREDVFITSILKYRPPNNRDPLPAEKAAFWPYLVRQLLVVQPQIIAPLGRHGMEYFLPGAKISQIHGQACRVPVKLPNNQQISWTIMPLYHPAAALYNGSMRAMLIDDFNKIPTILNALSHTKGNTPKA